MLIPTPRYISYSEFYCYYFKSPADYFNEYILGVSVQPTPEMKFGQIIHNAIENPDYNWKEAIQKVFLTLDYERIAEKIIPQIKREEQRELKLFVKTSDPELSLYAGIDAFNGEKLIEYKTGKGFWSQKRIDQDIQLTHYLLAWFLDKNVILPFELFSINTNNGKVKSLSTTRTQNQLMEHFDKLVKFKKELQERKWWDKKVPLKERIEIV